MSSALKQQFVSEAREQLEQIAKDVMTLEKGGASAAVFDSLFRQVHTLKGNCGLFDEMAMLGRALHHGEDQLDKLRESVSTDVLPEQLADLMLELLDFVEDVISRFEMDEADLHLDVKLKKAADQLVQRFSQLQGGGADESDSMAQALIHDTDCADASLPAWVQTHLSAMEGMSQDVVWVKYRPDEQAFFQGEDPLLNVMKLPGLVWSKAIWPELSEDELIDPFLCRVQLLAMSTASCSEVEEALTYVLENCEIYPLSPAAVAQSAAVPPVHEDAFKPALEPAVQKPACALWQAQILSLQPLLGRSMQDELLQRQLGVVSRVLNNLSQALSMPHWRAQIDLAMQASDLQQTLDTLAQLPLELQDQTLNPVADEPAASASPLSSTEAVGESHTQATTPTDPQTVTQSGAAQSVPAANRPKEILRVPRERVDRFMDLVGEMVVAKNALPFLAQRAEDEFGNREMAKLIREQFAVVNRIVDDMQDAVMRVRMTPVDAVFQRFPRLVRDLSRQLGKQVELRISGEDTEADKNMIERLAEPMIHLVRNTMDHGIEKPEVREALGKPASGTLEISAQQDGDRVLIELIDDGAGINRDKVAQKAIEKGLVTAEQVVQMKGQDVDDLIFSPGFSTADQISAVSGRGVGMDAVRSSIEAMGGEVSLLSEQGKGLRVSVSLPLSMAVSRVMVIESGGQQFGLPVEAVSETVRRPGSEFKHLQGAKALIMRNRLIPLKALNDVLEMGVEQTPNEEGEWAILVCRVRGQRLGLIIDDFKGTADVLVKPMDGTLSSLTHLQGTALLGDGSVLLVLDLMEMFAHEHTV